MFFFCLPFFARFRLDSFARTASDTIRFAWEHGLLCEQGTILANQTGVRGGGQSEHSPQAKRAVFALSDTGAARTQTRQQAERGRFGRRPTARIVRESPRSVTADGTVLKRRTACRLRLPRGLTWVKTSVAFGMKLSGSSSPGHLSRPGRYGCRLRGGRCKSA